METAGKSVPLGLPMDDAQALRNREVIPITDIIGVDAEEAANSGLVFAET